MFIDPSTVYQKKKNPQVADSISSFIPSSWRG